VVTVVDTPEVERKLAQGVQLLEVLPAGDFRKEHLPGARNIPIGDLTREVAARDLDPDRPVIVYCYDTECDLSARAAARLEAFGFRSVFDYRGSKTAWLAMDKPAEGTVPDAVRAGALARPATTCPAGSTLAELPPAGPGGVVLVVGDDDVVLGAIRPDEVPPDGDATALDVAQPGPTSVRPSITVDELARSMDEAGEQHVVVSTLDGVLIGIVERADLEVDR
jgi:rhodanese-related sulfurtransferase